MHNDIMVGVLGLGHDVVDIAGFEEQLNEPGTRMRALFSVRELRQAAMRGELKGDGESVHLAARWAGKEAVIKAWSEAIGAYDAPFTMDNTPWSQIEILDDSRGRPGVVLGEAVRQALYESVLGKGQCEPSPPDRQRGNRASVFQTDYAGSIPVIRSTGTLWMQGSPGGAWRSGWVFFVAMRRFLLIFERCQEG